MSLPLYDREWSELCGTGEVVCESVPDVTAYADGAGEGGGGADGDVFGEGGDGSVGGATGRLRRGGGGGREFKEGGGMDSRGDSSST